MPEPEVIHETNLLSDVRMSLWYLLQSDYKEDQSRAEWVWKQNADAIVTEMTVRVVLLAAIFVLKRRVNVHRVSCTRLQNYMMDTSLGHFRFRCKQNT